MTNDTPPIEGVLSTGTHGRFLLVPPEACAPAPMLVGFHGYGECAESHLTRLIATAGTDQWIRVSIQALHAFYRRDSRLVVGSWLTRQHRLLAMGDNVEFVNRVLDCVMADYATRGPFVFAGFSQGASMAFRAALFARVRPVYVIAVGGDLPPEFDSTALQELSAVLLCRGHDDLWYTEEKFLSDMERLVAAKVRVEPVRYEGGHEWSAAVVEASSLFLRDTVERRLSASYAPGAPATGL